MKIKITKSFVHNWITPALALLAICGVAACAFLDSLAVAAGGV